VVVEGESIEAADRSEIMGPLACLVGTQILYVEENLANIGFLVKLAQHIPDCRIIAATNALEGLALAKSAQPDLILLGMHMHGLDGFSALELLREDEKVMHIPVIALSPVAAPETIQKAYAAGFADFLTTPLQRDDFVGAVANALGNTRRSESQGKGASLSNQ
jgi:CheY-like chemotaxis protein